MPPQLCEKPLGGVRKELRPFYKSDVLMETPTDGDYESSSEIVVGKTIGSGIKTTYFYFDYSDIEDEQTDLADVWVYESTLQLRLKATSEGEDKFLPIQTTIHPVDDTKKTIKPEILAGDYSSILEETGAFKPLNRVPKRERGVWTEFTKTVQTFINPSGQAYNLPNNGFVLKHKYTGGENPNTDARDIRYHGTNTDHTEYVPYIDVCYKVVERKRCQHGETEVEIPLFSTDTGTIDSGDPDGNKFKSNLKVGVDKNGIKRSLIKFNVEQFDENKYEMSTISEAWIHLTFSDFSDRTVTPSDHTINISKVSEQWFEKNVTWNEAPAPNGEPFITFKVPHNQPGLSQMTVEVEVDDVGAFLDDLLKNHEGIIMTNDDETTEKAYPEFLSKATAKDYPKPSLHVCVAEIPPTTTTPTPTNTPTASVTSSPTTTPTEMKLTNCTIPNGGGRVVVDLRDSIIIKEDPMSNVDPNYLQIGQIPGKGENMLLVYFDVAGALEKAGINEDLSVTDSRVNFRLSPVDDSATEWVPGTPTMYPLKKKMEDSATWDYPWDGAENGPQPSMDYYSTMSAKFNKLRRTPREGRWLQAVSTNLVRYLVTKVSEVKMDNLGFLMKFVTDDPTKDASHFLKMYSNGYGDDEFHPWLDVCYLPVAPPEPCAYYNEAAEKSEEGVWVEYDVNADTYLSQDSEVHGTDEHVLVGNSGWDGYVRSLVDFDISTFPSASAEVNPGEKQVYLKMWYDGPTMGKPYNDPRQIERDVSVHLMKKNWNEEQATNKVAMKTGGSKYTWSKTMMSDTADYEAESQSSLRMAEGEAIGFKYWDITDPFRRWVNTSRSDHLSDYGVVLKDSIREGVPGNFLQFNSMDHPNRDQRPKVMVCQQKPTCQPYDDEPKLIYDQDMCISQEEVTMNTCQARNGACVSNQTETDHGYFLGVTAFHDSYHILRSFCLCCVEKETYTKKVPMDCSAKRDSGISDKADYDYEVIMIDTCQCIMCREVSKNYVKRAAPSKTRLLLRSALKSMLRQ